MMLEELETILEKKGYDALYVEIVNKKNNENRLYLELEAKKERKFNIYFSDFQGKPFLYVFINRPEEQSHNIEMNDEEKKQCLEAKLKVLRMLKNDGVRGVEQYKNLDSVLLCPQKDNKKRIEL